MRSLQQLSGSLGRPASFLDIGSNVGWFTLLAAASRHAHVIAVEASKENTAILDHSLCTSGLSAHVVACFTGRRSVL